MILGNSELLSLNEVNSLLPARAWNENRAYTESGESRGREWPILNLCVPVLWSGYSCVSQQNYSIIMWLKWRQEGRNQMCVKKLQKVTKHMGGNIFSMEIHRLWFWILDPFSSFFFFTSSTLLSYFLQDWTRTVRGTVLQFFSYRGTRNRDRGNSARVNSLLTFSLPSSGTFEQ